MSTIKTIKQKTLWTFISEGFGKETCSLIYFPKPPESLSIALYPNDVRTGVQPFTNGRCCICLDICINFIIESIIP